MKFQLTIARKMFGLSLLAVLFMIAVGVAGLYARHFLTVGADRVLAGQQALRYHANADQAHDALRGDVLAALLLAREIDRNEATAIRKEMDAHVAELGESLQKLQEMEFDARTREALDKTRPALEAYATEARALVTLAYQDRIAAVARLENFLAKYKALAADMEALGDTMEQRARAAQAESREVSVRTGHMVTAGLVVACFVLLVIAWSISRNMVRRLDRAVQVARSVAAGDLSSRIEVAGDDEAAHLLQALARMNASLVGLVGTVRQATDNIASGTVQIASGNQDLSQRTEEQASNLQQTAASMEQISATVRANADTTRRANAMAASVSESAARSGEAVQKLVASMSGITEASRRITDIIGVIDGIAFQTNILALNAAVEAARAGEQGRGFAVVAAEVRTLAQRSAAAAKEIKTLIQQSVERVRAGEREALEAGDTMADVVQQVRAVTTLLQEIGSVTEEQNKGITAVSQAVTQIDHVTQNNASLVEEAAAAAESLSRQAAALVEAVALFRTEREPLVPA